MIERLRQFLSTGPGKVVGIVGCLVLLGILILQMKSQLGQSTAEASSRNRIFICAETGKTFNVKITEGMKVPALSPYSGKDTGYPPELCYWTKDGKVSKSPTYVVMNEYAGKKGATFCPDCGRLVVHGNPPASPDAKPPLLKEQYDAKMLGRNQP